jgi:hypothetical protein
MEKEALKRILDFFVTKEGKELPQKWFSSMPIHELINYLETYPDDEVCEYNRDLSLSRKNIIKLPKVLHVNGFLNLSDSSIIELPNELYVIGELNLVLCRKIRKLPNTLYVRDSLMLVHSNVKELPEELKVGGNLHIYNTPLAEKYTNDEIIEMITSKGGKLSGKIYR